MTPLLETSRHGRVTLLRLSRAANRNALNAELIADLTTPAAGIQHSRAWRRPFEPIEYGPVPVLAVLRGAVLGGSLEHGAGEPTKPAHGAVTPIARKGGWMKRHESFVARARKGDVDVGFLGDSIMYDWEGRGKAVWKKSFEPLKAVNFGISGDQTRHVLWRITAGQELSAISPKVFVVMIGTNNMAAHTAGQIAEGVSAIAKELQRQKPTAKVLVLGIFPRSASGTALIRAKIKDTNQRLAKLADGKQVFYLDIGARFLTADGALTKEIMYDALHLTPKGYAIWADAIKPTLDKLLAAAAQIRVTERSTYYAFLEGRHGIFVAGAGLVSVPRLIGAARIRDMMLTGRANGAEEGAALGFAQYLVDDSHGLSQGIELAARMASNAVPSSFAVLLALPRIARVEPETGLLLESLMAGKRLRQSRQLPRPGAARLLAGGRHATRGGVAGSAVSVV
jgi:enoyl-CoA hydratase/carnithine racemase/lysophospholipase L1-like esterase